MSLNSQIVIPGDGTKSIVLVGLMGAGKTAIGKRLAAQLGWPFHDADQEIERAAGITIAEIFERHGEAHFRAGEKRVIARLLDDGPIVLSPGGGAFMDAETRALIRRRAISIWLRCPVPILVQRVSGKANRPLLNGGNAGEILHRLSLERGPLYAQADIIVDGSGDPPHVTTENVLTAVRQFKPPQRINVAFGQGSYEILIGSKILARAGAYLAPILPQPRCVIITDETVSRLHLTPVQNSLNETGIRHETIVVPPGEASKSFAAWESIIHALLAQRVDRKTTIIALGGGVVGDLAGFAAAATLRGLPFVQIPTTLLAQVDSSVGGKTGINTPHGKNLVGAFHQPRQVLMDIDVLTTLPLRELRAGYAEIVKAGLISEPDLYDWCEANAASVLAGDKLVTAEAIEKAVRFKARVVGDDEREAKPNDGRALLNFGHSFAHALEAETGYGGALLHGEAVAIGLVLATALSVFLGLCPAGDTTRIAGHFARVGLPINITGLKAENLLAHMKQDKKMFNGKLNFVLTRGIGKAFTSQDVPEEAVKSVLLSHGGV